ncbi:MAG: hypothetical protein EH225_09200 [Calditrichaeota bacterium]|nr:MAG: hypothetical protein EH225_09200 [Calditrichota bacterium]
MEKMIDIHAHLIPQFDDGPRSFEESLEMLWQAADQGITNVFATSHFNEWIPEEIEREYFDKLEILRNMAGDQDIPVTIHSGAEIFYHHYVNDTIRKSAVATLGNWKQYCLIEFPMFQYPDGAEEILFRLTAENVIPVVAHPERYVAIIGKIKKINEFIRFGGLLQLNGGSILGYFGKDIRKTAMQLLERQLVHFIASDAHSPQGRTFVLGEVCSFLEDKLPEDYLIDLVYGNQKKILDKVQIEPIKLPEPEEKKGLFSSLRQKIR